MLSKENRLTKNKYFQYIYKKGEKVSSANITVVFAPTKLKPIKIGITVNNKIGDAVVRNKVKRRLRAILRSLLKDLNQKYNYVIVVRPSIINLDFLEIRKELKYVLKKGNLLNESI